MSKKFLNPKPMTKSELAAAIGISLSTFRRKLKKAEVKLPRGLIFPKDFYTVLIIFYPDKMIEHLRDVN